MRYTAISQMSVYIQYEIYINHDTEIQRCIKIWSSGHFNYLNMVQGLAPVQHDKDDDSDKITRWQEDLKLIKYLIY